MFDEGWCKYFEVYNKILGLINNMMNGGFLFYKVKVKKLKIWNLIYGFVFVYIKFDLKSFKKNIWRKICMSKEILR